MALRVDEYADKENVGMDTAQNYTVATVQECIHEQSPVGFYDPMNKQSLGVTQSDFLKILPPSSIFGRLAYGKVSCRPNPHYNRVIDADLARS